MSDSFHHFGRALLPTQPEQPNPRPIPLGLHGSTGLYVYRQPLGNPLIQIPGSSS